MSSAGSFTIQFHSHLPAPRVEQAIEMLQRHGAHVEPEAAHQFVVLCENERQVNEVGVSLFHTHLQSLAQVVAVSGLASQEAGAYHFPKSRAERKKHRN